ncbi:unnamed protein product [Schistosoma mattheei]|uniref:Uncharacterized protein n=1 Tax=Schistosoma mattheei TaxID=31246 RepID=A0A183PL60_9TREM|nr:unnamed protein product [Schistosoma mattheei]
MFSNTPLQECHIVLFILRLLVSRIILVLNTKLCTGSNRQHTAETFTTNVNGKIILFKVAIVLLNRLFGHPSHRKSCQGLDDILMRLREVSSVVGKLDNFIREVVRVPITTKELSQQIVRQSQKWAANHQKQS